MAVISDALRQAFMPKHDYEALREEDRAFPRLRKPLLLSALTLISLCIVVSTYASLAIVFPGNGVKRPFCEERLQPLSINATERRDDVFPGAFYLTDQETVDYYWMVVFVPSGLLFLVSFAYLAAAYVSLAIVLPGNGVKRPFCEERLQPLSINATERGDDVFPGAFYLTDQETVDYYWMVVFVPSALLFVVSFAYLAAGITVAYNAPTRHWSLKVVENNYCASKRGGVRCLAILNLVFAIIFGLLALFLGSTLLTLGSNCSSPLFWCYEITSWGLVILYGATAFFLRRKAASVLDESDSSGRNFGLEMLEANPVEVSPDMERRVNEGFKSWMGSSYLSSDDEDDPNDYQEVPHITRTNSNRQRV